MQRLFRKHAYESEPDQTYLVVGLGNPGREYKMNRHNIGFLVVDLFADAHTGTFTRIQAKSVVKITKTESHKIILVKPQTFMNLSGDSVLRIQRFYKVSPEKTLVIHDDIDLPLGTIRIRESGSAAGHKGVASIISRLNTQEFPRLRLGVGRPEGKKQAASYVLEDFSKSEQELLKITLARAVDAIQMFIDKGIEPAMNGFNGS